MRLVPEPPPDTAAVGDVVGAGVLAPAVEGAAVAVAVTVAVVVVAEGARVVAGGAAVVAGGAAVVAGGAAVAVGAAVAALLVTLPIALLTELPHPAARHPAARIATRMRKALLVHRMLAIIR
jgi:hypothetical protein